MTTSFHQALRAGRILFFDGAMGTMLAAREGARGVDVSITKPLTSLAVHAAYRKAGADVLITNTFDANRQMLSDAGTRTLLRFACAGACEDARDAAGPQGFVAGDIGPTGELLEPYGTMTEAAMRAAFEETARLLAAGGVDLFVIETMSDTREMTLAVEACRAAAKELPIAASMAFDPSRQGGFRTSMGVSPTDAARAMAAAGADILGANCGAITPEQMAEVVREFRRASNLPILAQPNAGLPELRAGQAVFSLSPESFAAGMMQVIAAGARLLGGCCGTTPAHIAALVAATKK